MRGIGDRGTTATEVLGFHQPSELKIKIIGGLWSQFFFESAHAVRWRDAWR